MQSTLNKTTRCNVIVYIINFGVQLGPLLTLCKKTAPIKKTIMRYAGSDPIIS